MKTVKIAILAAAAAVLTAFTTISMWQVDPGHSEVGFSITHLGISDISGTFNDFQATVQSEKADFSDAVVEATINVGSINTRIEGRDKHLRTADFFDAEKFPTITFKSKAISKVSENNYTLTGDLTAKGITKTVNMNLTYRGTIENPAPKKSVAGLKLTGVIKRTDFEIGSKYPAAMLSDEVTITINTEVKK